MRLVGFLFLGLTFAAGLFLGTLEYALINAVVFLALALLAARYLAHTARGTGTVYGMGGAFFASLMWPYLLIAVLAGDECSGDQCLAGPGLGLDTGSPVRTAP